ncbi:hypothetical protein K474DRAFT_923593 [Panus rudis PR-1116 ss-1]|nr:hypothetical protein K474DRAFT_923593 [Panus rudis PR-1116 ss-1]
MRLDLLTTLFLVPIRVAILQPTATMKASAAYLFLLTACLANALILIGTLIKTFRPEEEELYTWLDRDNPLEMPIGPIPTVEMTFQESRRFSFSDDDSRDNWETLFTNQFGIGFAHLGPFHHRFISAAYHSLHCLYSMTEDFDQPDHLGNPSHHFVHCLMYMRQIFLCNADATLEPGDFMARNLTIDRMGPTRQCRDWTYVGAWIDANFREWSEFNGVNWD